MFPIPQDDSRPIHQGYQELCNAEDGRVFKAPVIVLLKNGKPHLAKGHKPKQIEGYSSAQLKFEYLERISPRLFLEGHESSQEEQDYINRLNKKKVIVFQYETGVIGHWNLFKQIERAHLSTQEIINVVNAASERSHFSDEQIEELKYSFKLHMSHRKDLMDWVAGEPLHPEDTRKISAPILSKA